MSTEDPLPPLPVIHRATVIADWIDYNGHFNAGYYAVVFDDAVGPWLAHCGLTPEHRADRGITSFTAESHVLYLREVREGDGLEITGQLIAYGDKKIHSFLRMYERGASTPAATYELMSIHIDLAARRPAPLHDEVTARLGEVAAAQGSRGLPPQAGRVISVAGGRPPADPPR